LQVLKFSIL